jgi:uncharacterized membrane protein YgdD (TMEM256/DUF423 family)
MKNNWAAIAAFSLALAISLGAWNAHGMEKFVENGQILEKYLKTFHTGVEYQFINSIGILVLGLFGLRDFPKLKNAILFIFIGMCVFSFSLYLLSFHQLLGAGFKILGAITPIGGLFMIVGWIYTGILFLKINKK